MVTNWVTLSDSIRSPEQMRYRRSPGLYPTLAVDYKKTLEVGDRERNNPGKACIPGNKSMYLGM